MRNPQTNPVVDDMVGMYKMRLDSDSPNHYTTYRVISLDEIGMRVRMTCEDCMNSLELDISRAYWEKSIWEGNSTFRYLGDANDPT